MDKSFYILSAKILILNSLWNITDIYFICRTNTKKILIMETNRAKKTIVWI